MNPVIEALISDSESTIKALRKKLEYAKTKTEQVEIEQQIEFHERRVDNLLATA